MKLIEQLWDEFYVEVVVASGAPAEIHELIRCAFYSGSAALTTAIHKAPPEDVDTVMASLLTELQEYMEE